MTGEPIGRRRLAAISAAATWAVVVAGVSLLTFEQVNDDARVLIALAAVVGTALGMAAAVAWHRGTDRAGGVLLALSALVSPTYAAAAVNLLPLVAGLYVLWRPTVLDDPPSRSGRPGR